MMIDAEFVCVYCTRVNFISVDPAGGRFQQYVEDCQNCCRPHLLSIEIEIPGNAAHVTAEAES